LSEVQLRVLDSRQRDVARGIARIDQRTMQKLGVSSEDVIEILGKKKTSAIAWPAYSETRIQALCESMGSYVKMPAYQ